MATGIDPQQLQAFFARDPDSDSYYDILSIPHEFEPLQALELTREIASLAPDDHGLCWLGVSVLEPLLELHWSEIQRAFVKAMTSDKSLRRAFSCV